MPKGGGRETVKEVMGKYKRGNLHSGSSEGPTVDSRDQAIAIALKEAGIERRPEKPPKRRKRPAFGI